MSSESQNRRPPSSLYTQVEVTPSTTVGPSVPAHSGHDEQTELLRDVLAGQDRTNELLEELLAAMNTAQKQRAGELNQWKQANDFTRRVELLPVAADLAPAAHTGRWGL